ncbi:peptidoglycan DD-metalloendopeptidase family protein [Suttonella sp. R2A3]|uniref:peptidoglycan DD-metalloendopeptidase family protein n=1 Tax=Suttonella sp. R2A3 TaxID=2908648 RepID=UPI001F2CF8FF|nr:peptidoglycan DD-metalloendopeptidase family protein [Suttonella sp. R2A3]UJF24722.1 peptidoglycan DD-metalloendopeptidase family protein [Suttonella sp. R2A3]
MSAYQLHGERGALAAKGQYLIKKGDTLFGIAWKHGLDLQELASWNNISNPNRILAGTMLRLEPPRGVERAKVVAPAVTRAAKSGWVWPTTGNVVREFASNKPGHQGIKIAGGKGQPIVAASDGEVAYSGTGLSGFGRMVIIKHDDKVLSAYGYLQSANVREGQRVRKGDTIATMGISPQNIAALHFETRKGGRPVNPYGFIGTSQR